MCRVHLEPLGATVEVAPNQDLADVLFPYGVEFPCGGTGRCRGCRVRVVQGEVAVTAEMRRAFSASELAAGWRLACRARIEGDVTLEVAQWETALLGDTSTLPVVPRVGYGVAVDVGTTTLAAQLLDLETGDVLAVQTALNPQAASGADVMTRIEYALKNPGQLCEVVRARIGKLIGDMVEGLEAAKVVSVLLCGNTVMHHLFGAIDVAPLAAAPFAATELGPVRFRGEELGWPLAGDCEVEFLPCLGGFVGSDI
ncbi:MAG: 2Fe-2S iron-sulfur cluster binding domain-containing protein, partial [Bryobacterales bacterium]|nr:2Fe-2S iron-sulfur cluster binding domain-containing protein [Bryobacterales bacterium]